MINIGVEARKRREPFEGRVASLAWIEVGSDNKRLSFPTYLRHWSPALIAKFIAVSLENYKLFYPASVS